MTRNERGCQVLLAAAQNTNRISSVQARCCAERRCQMLFLCVSFVNFLFCSIYYPNIDATSAAFLRQYTIVPAKQTSARARTHAQTHTYSLSHTSSIPIGGLFWNFLVSPVSATLLLALPLLPFSFLHKIQSMQVTSSQETFDTSVFDSIRQRADNLFFGRALEECSPSLELVSTSNSSFPPSYSSVRSLAALAL